MAEIPTPPTDNEGGGQDDATLPTTPATPGSAPTVPRKSSLLGRLLRPGGESPPISNVPEVLVEPATPPSTGDEFIDRKRAEIDKRVQESMTPASSVPAPSPVFSAPVFAEPTAPVSEPVETEEERQERILREFQEHQATLDQSPASTSSTPSPADQSPPERSFADIIREEGLPPGGPRRPEGPNGPEGPRGPEWLTSPERGREIVLEIIRLETDMTYTQRYAERTGPLSETNPEIYNERHGTYLDQLYMDLKDYVGGLKEIRNNRDIKDPWDQQEVYTRMAENMARQADDRIRSAHFEIGERQVLPEESISQLWEQYLHPDANTDLPTVQDKLAKYFMEGRALGMIQIGEGALRGIYNQIQTGKITRDQATDVLIEKVAKAKILINNVFMSQRTKPYIAGNGVNLIGLAEAYAERTFHQFTQFLAGDTPVHIEGEMRFDEEGEDISEEDKETYWRPGHYPKMYEILANTEQQFRTAANSFLTMVTNGSVGKSPDDLYQHFENFKDALGQVGSQRSQAGIIENEFMKNLRVEMEAHGFIFGANYSNETYNPESFNKFMMAMALHEGPDRWVRLARSGNGAVGAFLWKFDHDPRITLFHNTSGSRGQLQSDTITQHYLQDQIRDILIEEGMGVVLKSYDPRDEKSIRGDADSIKVLNDREKISEPDTEMEKARVKYFKNNQEIIGIHQTEEDFKNLYEGFDTGDSHKVNYERYKDLDEKSEEWKKLSVEIRRSVIIGKVQAALKEKTIKGRNRDQLHEAIDDLIRERRLTPRDKKIWEDAYDKASSAFDVAFQMVGVSGEKVRRGGGVFYVHRWKDISPHIAVYETYKNTDDRRLNPEQQALKRSGRIQLELRKPEKERKLKDGDTAFMAELIERNRFVDHMPVYLAEQFVQTIENLCKIENANASAVVRADAVALARAGAIKQIKQNGFEAKVEVPVLKYDTDENSPTFGEVIGKDGNLTRTIDFQTAVDSIHSRWTSHTYASYQQENRHMLTDPKIVKLAKKIRAGLVKPDEVDNLASWLLILDPTLKRVVRIEEVAGREEGSMVAGPGKSAMNMEVLLFDAAVEASNMGHWRINEELNLQFFSKNGDTTEMLTGYNLEDYGGISRFIIRMKQFIAPHAKRFARRYASELARTPMHVSSMPDQWGQQGMMGAIEMMADPIGKMASQPESSQFAITKFAEQMRLGNLLYGALVGHVDHERGFSIEGLFEKPTNNSEKLHGLQKKVSEITGGSKDAEVELLHGMLESLDRLWTVLKIIRTMESDTRNAQGALDLEVDDVFIDGKLNTKLGTDRNTGSSRHSDKIFFDSFIKWMISTEEGHGAKAYPGETGWYALLGQKTTLDPNLTRAEWLFNKMAR